MTTLGGPTALSAYVTDDAPTGSPTSPRSVPRRATATSPITLDEAVSGQFVTIWLTSLPAVTDGFRGTIAEVVVKG